MASSVKATGSEKSSVPAAPLQDLAGITYVRVDVVGGTLSATGQQRTGVREHQRIVVDVDDPRRRRHLLGNLASVAGGR